MLRPAQALCCSTTPSIVSLRRQLWAWFAVGRCSARLLLLPVAFAVVTSISGFKRASVHVAQRTPVTQDQPSQTTSRLPHPFPAKQPFPPTNPIRSNLPPFNLTSATARSAAGHDTRYIETPTAPQHPRTPESCILPIPQSRKGAAAYLRPIHLRSNDFYRAHTTTHTYITPDKFVQARTPAGCSFGVRSHRVPFLGHISCSRTRSLRATLRYVATRREKGRAEGRETNRKSASRAIGFSGSRISRTENFGHHCPRRGEKKSHLDRVATQHYPSLLSFPNSTSAWAPLLAPGSCLVLQLNQHPKIPHHHLRKLQTCLRLCSYHSSLANSTVAAVWFSKRCPFARASFSFS
ncbi:hypothetical protein FN846DRAFT_59914 [Sphaerosporella brunnea]|uniref:Uncharacterized protein n=1 Tax=Sphaerosporella brunnea TaxID=1250544 RepID=A0A5J5F9B5_9PEZI|nr:hypothetical protein FN846DRAFT_59914 [Sphaerosporella brunnea]